MQQQFDLIEKHLLSHMDKFFTNRNVIYFSELNNPYYFDLLFHAHVSSFVLMGGMQRNKLNENKYPKLAEWYARMNTLPCVYHNSDRLSKIIDEKELYGVYLEPIKRTF